jgi:hypothetical protein
LPVSITTFINITPIPARAFISIFSPTASSIFKPISVFFISPLSLLPINAVSTSSLSPSLIRSLPSLTYSDLAAKYAEFEYDHSDDNRNKKDSYTLPAAISESNLMPLIIDP